MSVLKKFKKKFISKLRRIRKHYRYKVYFPKVYSSYCTESVQENKVLFLEMRFTKLSNSFELIYKALEESGEYDLKCSYVQFNFIRGREFTQRVNEMLKELATAKYVFVDDASLILSSIPLRKETVAINLWHACGAFKKFGRSTAELKFGSSAATLDKYPNYGNLTHVTVSSPEVIWAYEEAMHLPKGIVKATGVSRTDQFYDKKFVESRKQKLYEIMPEAKDKKVILYAPTFRGHVATASSPDRIDFERFCRELGNEYVIVCKHHPFVKNPPIIPEELQHFARDLTKYLSIEDLLCCADICISDYSSLVFEYSLFEKPMIFYAYDYDNYCDWRGFYYDYSEFTPGPVVQTEDELLNSIKNIDTQFDKQKVIDFKEKFMGSCDGHATERIIALMKEI
ncbi:CDP-glycerol glycerophosphotransferase family protein [Anaerobutyricum hallii]|uniref:CDP-glycerol glycerophosphotransferase family protein n=1 Tax=Anaerobutyricum hallii TaxID=39488 RepID=UPI001D06470C|nr:CDP-glycerol glycerophosphotransferase family protein [Anaerobutyricum hallii]MCB6935737.1 CDP-glycerol glycerophosphotransferase family protein [Anaerobutyricum hallii]